MTESKKLPFILLVIILSLPIIFLIYKHVRFFSLEKSSSNRVDISQNQDNMVPSNPKVAIIFDDLGDSLRPVKDIFSLKIPLTISIIPYLKFSKNIAYICFQSGMSVMVHLPMEGKDGYSNAPYLFIRKNMSAPQIISLTRRYLNYIQIAQGVNNHMGSSITEDRKIMELILKEVKKKNMFFVDSKTTDDSVVCSVARDLDVSCVENSGFLDPYDKKDYIKERLYQLIALAKERGKIVIIAHPRKNTLEVLKEEIPKLKEKVDFITIKEFLEK